MCFAECASFFSKTGGPFLYAKEAFGEFVGFEVGFVTWAIRIIAEATLYVAFATALGAAFPALAGPVAKDVIVTIMFVLLGLLNISGAKITSWVANVATVSKLVPILLVIIVGLFFINTKNFEPFFVQKLTTAPNFAAAAITLFYVFTGFEGTVVIAGELKDAKKNLPKALMISVGTVVIIYILIMVTSIGVLGPDLKNSAAPLKDTFTKIAGNFGGNLITLGTLLSIGGICISSSFITPRSGVALAEDKMMPKVLAKTNQREAPYVSIIVSSLISLAIAYSDTFTALAQISAVSRFAQFIPTCIAVLVFRRTKKDVAHSFKTPLGPTIPLIALAASGWLLWHVDVKSLVWGLGGLVIAVPFYFIAKWNNQRTQAN